MNHWIIESKSREVLNRKWEWNPRVKVTTDICNSCFDRDAKSGRGKHAPAIVPFWFIVHVCVQRMFIRVFSPGWKVYPVLQLVHKPRFSLVCASRDRLTASGKVKVNIWDPTNWMQLQVYCNLKTQGGERGGQGLFKDPAYPMVEMICVAYQKHIFDNK